MSVYRSVSVRRAAEIYVCWVTDLMSIFRSCDCLSLFPLTRPAQAAVGFTRYVDWIHLAQRGDQWQDLASPGVAKEAAASLSSWTTVRFSKTQLNGDRCVLKSKFWIQDASGTEIYLTVAHDWLTYYARRDSCHSYVTPTQAEPLALLRELHSWSAVLTRHTSLSPLGVPHIPAFPHLIFASSIFLTLGLLFYSDDGGRTFLWNVG
jgi:hypothetical protein